MLLQKFARGKKGIKKTTMVKKNKSGNDRVYTVVEYSTDPARVHGSEGQPPTVNFSIYKTFAELEKVYKFRCLIYGDSGTPNKPFEKGIVDATKITYAFGEDEGNPFIFETNSVTGFDIEKDDYLYVCYIQYPHQIWGVEKAIKQYMITADLEELRTEYNKALYDMSNLTHNMKVRSLKFPNDIVTYEPCERITSCQEVIASSGEWEGGSFLLCIGRYAIAAKIPNIGYARAMIESVEEQLAAASNGEEDDEDDIIITNDDADEDDETKFKDEWEI